MVPLLYGSRQGEGCEFFQSFKAACFALAHAFALPGRHDGSSLP